MSTLAPCECAKWTKARLMPVGYVGIDASRVVRVEDHLSEPPPVTTTIFCASGKSPNMTFSVGAKQSTTESDKKGRLDPRR